MSSTYLLGMTTLEEQQYIRWHAEHVYTGQGAIVDLGSWLGSTVIPFAEGLERNPRPEARAKIIHAFDRFTWTKYMEPMAAGSPIAGVYREGDSFLDEFQRRVERWKSQIDARAVDLRDQHWGEEPIEYLLVDAMKTWRLTNSILRQCFPRVLPDVGYVIHQDFAHFYAPWIHLLSYRLRDYFGAVRHVENSGAVVFRCLQAVPDDVVRRWYSFSSFSPDEVDAAYDYAYTMTGRWMWPHLAAARVMVAVHQGSLDEARRLLEGAKKQFPDRPRVFLPVDEKLAEWEQEIAQWGSTQDLAWHVTLDHPFPALRQGNAYSLEFQIRADRPRSVYVAVIEGKPPWSLRGLYQHVRISGDWQSFGTEFTANADEPHPRFQIRAGESDIPFEIAQVRFEEVGADSTGLSSADVSLVRHPDRSASLEFPAEPATAVRVRFEGEEAPIAHSWTTRLVHAVGSLQAGEHVEISFEARSDAPRALTVTLNEPNPPWTVLAPARDIPVGTGWRLYSIQFVPERSSELGGLLQFHMGTHDGAVEIRQPSWGARAAGWQESTCVSGWFLATEPGRSAILDFPPTSDDVLRVDIGRVPLAKAGNPWEVSLSHPLPAVRAHEIGELSFLARASRPVGFQALIDSGAPPWSALSSTFSLTAGQGWRRHRIVVHSPTDADHPRLVFLLGESEEQFEFDQARWKRGDGSIEALSFADWGLSSTPPRKARLNFPPDNHGEGTSVAVERESADGLNAIAPPRLDPWTTQLHHPIGPLSPHQVGRLLFDARASHPRPLSIAIVDRSRPEIECVPKKTFVLGTGWRRHVLEFPVLRPSDDGELRVQVGGSDVPVTLRNLRWQTADEAPPAPLSWNSWRLTAEEKPASLDFPDDQSELVHVSFAPPTPTIGEPWDVLLRHPLGAVQEGVPARLEFEAKASDPRTLDVLIAQAHEPWLPLGPRETIHLGTGWRHYSFLLPIHLSDSLAEVSLQAGSNDIDLSIRKARFAQGESAPIPLEESWSMAGPRSSAHGFEEEDGVVSISSMQEVGAPPIGQPGEQRLEYSLPAVKAGCRYRLTWRGRGEQPCWIAARMSSSSPPWTVFAGPKRIKLATQWRDYSLSFDNLVDDDAPRLVIEYGHHRTPFELSELSFRRVSSEGDERHRLSPYSWRILASDDPWSATEFPDSPDHPIRVIPDLDVRRAHQGANAWHIELLHPLRPFEQGATYLWSFRARSDRPRMLQLVVNQNRAPWGQLGFWRELRCSNDWQRFRFEFTASASEPSPRLEFQLGGAEPSVEIRDLVFTSPGASSTCLVGSWKLLTHQGMRALLRRPSELEGGVRVDIVRNH